VSDDESLEDVVQAFVAGRFFEAIDDAPSPPTGGLPEYPTD
jgi:hypothetical protein